MTHLLDRIAAFIDGELDHAERDRVMVHLASCAVCRDEVAMHRALKSRLANLTAPEPSAGLLAEIRRLAEPGEPLAAQPDTATVPLRIGWSLPGRSGSQQSPGSGPNRTTRPPSVGVGGRPLRGRERRRSRPRRVRAIASAALLAATTTLVTAFAVGGAPVADAPPLRPDLNTFLVDHARSSGEVPFAPLPADTVDVSFRAGSRR